MFRRRACGRSRVLSCCQTQLCKRSTPHKYCKAAFPRHRMRPAKQTFPFERGGRYTTCTKDVLPTAGIFSEHFLTMVMSSRPNHSYEFGPFVLDPAERTLHRGADPVTLPPKVFDTLVMLVERHGRLVGKEEFIRKLWEGDAFVEEGNLTKNISLVRKALGDGENGDKYIKTVPTRGYRFVADVRTVSAARDAELFETAADAGRPEVDAVIVKPAVPTTRTAPAPLAAKPGAATTDWVATRLAPRRSVIITAALLALTLGALAYGWRWRQSSVAPQAEIKSLAVLPLKSLDADENYLGLGIADAVIRRISQTRGLIVRPTSAVRRYLNEDTDAITAARQLNADAVLEGSVQRNDDRLRVSVSLLRTSDGASLWAENFDMRTADIFTIQDTVAQRVASHLRLRLDPAQQARLIKHSTSSALAYEFYVKGVYSSDQRGFGIEAKPQMEATISLFKKAIEADPNFALAHAQLANAYIWTAIFIEQQAVWAEQAKEEINRAEALDPQLAETHVARHWLLCSAYGGFQSEAAVRELLLAQRLNPNVGHVELGSIYYHLGLEDLGDRAYQRALDIDPTSEYVKYMTYAHYGLVRKYDEWLATFQKFNPDKTTLPSWYLLGKGRLDEAQKAVDVFLAKNPGTPRSPVSTAFFSALKGDFRTAEAQVPAILKITDPNQFAYHHLTYDVACIYALSGKTDEAVKWLRKTAAEGFPSYTLFQRDRYLDRIRQEPEFIQFMEEMKALHERYRREFA